MKCCPTSPYRCAHIVLPLLVLAVLGALITSLVLTSDAEAEVPSIHPAVQAIQKHHFSGKVIIVGGGAAGLFAAYTLEYLNITNYEILEAHADTYGGRVREMNDFVDVPLDLGAEWIHVNPKVLQDLLLFDDALATMQEIVYQPQTYAAYRNGRLRRRDWMRFFYKEYKFFNSTWFGYLRDFVYPHVAHRLRLDAVVTTIDYQDPQQVVVTNAYGQEYTGTHVIVATPVTVLQQQDIAFDPPLSTSMVEALDAVDMPPGLKVWIEFHEHFYADIQLPHGLLSFADDDALYLDALFRKPSVHNVTLLFEVGHNARARVEMDEQDLLADILVELDQMYDGQASQHYVQHRIQNWSKEPYVKGSFSSNTYSMDEMLTPAGGGRIYFCGEHLAPGPWDQSTVHGAAMSGRQTAMRLVMDAAL